MPRASPYTETEAQGRRAHRGHRSRRARSRRAARRTPGDLRVGGAENDPRTVKGARIEDRPMGGVERALGVVSDPNVAYVLFLVGLVGLYFELSTPGAILPGVAGAISLLLALYAFSVLPGEPRGLALILLGICPVRRRGEGGEPRRARGGRRDRARRRLAAAVFGRRAGERGYRVDLSVVLPAARRDARDRGPARVEDGAARGASPCGPG